MENEMYQQKPCTMSPGNSLRKPGLPLDLSRILRPCELLTAVERASLVIGCYRKGDVGDPEIYQRAVVAVLARYPESVVIAVTEPATGIPSKLKWLPTIAEIVEACDAQMGPILRQHARDKLAADRRKMLPPPPSGPRPTKAELDAVLSKAKLRTIPDAPVKRPLRDGYADRAMVDLVARKRRREMLGAGE
jgi:hypothetical protein